MPGRRPCAVLPAVLHASGQSGAGWKGCCAPMSHGGQPPPDPGSSWSTRWGAVAIDVGAGKFGSVDGAIGKRSAYKAAVAACKGNRGRKYKVILLGYYNQCGAIAWGSRRVESFSAAQEQEAMDGAMESVGRRPRTAGSITRVAATHSLSADVFATCFGPTLRRRHCYQVAPSRAAGLRGHLRSVTRR